MCRQHRRWSNFVGIDLRVFGRRVVTAVVVSAGVGGSIGRGVVGTGVGFTLLGIWFEGVSYGLIVSFELGSLMPSLQVSSA